MNLSRESHYVELTCVGFWLGVLDVGRELCEDVISRCIRLLVLCSQLWIPWEVKRTKLHHGERSKIKIISMYQFHNRSILSTYFGGASISSKNSSILLTSVRTSPLNVRKGGGVPGARLWRSAGFLFQIKDIISAWINPKSVMWWQKWYVVMADVWWSPLQVDGGDVEHNTLQPQDHKESLRERTVSNALAITTRLKNINTNIHNSTRVKNITQQCSPNKHRTFLWR